MEVHIRSRPEKAGGLERIYRIYVPISTGSIFLVCPQKNNPSHGHIAPHAAHVGTWGRQNEAGNGPGRSGFLPQTEQGSAET